MMDLLEGKDVSISPQKCTVIEKTDRSRIIESAATAASIVVVEKHNDAMRKWSPRKARNETPNEQGAKHMDEQATENVILHPV